MELTVKGLEYYYQDGEDNRYIFNDLNVSFVSGKFYTIIGESGSGKTTLLSLLGALDRPKGGTVTLDGADIYQKMEEYRKKAIGFVFQNYNLIAYLNAIENIEIALDIAKVKKTRSEILNLLKLVGIDETKTKRVVSKLSGGEMQRVAIARAIATDPPIILGDEPTGNLDSDTSDNIVDLFTRLAHEFNKCIIIVTHNKNIAKLSDVIYEVDPKQKNLRTIAGSLL